MSLWVDARWRVPVCHLNGHVSVLVRYGHHLPNKMTDRGKEGHRYT